MDDDRFDHLARVLGGGASRRAALGLAVFGLGAVLRRGDPAAAKGKGKRKACRPRCGKGETCVHGACLKQCAKPGTCSSSGPGGGPPSCGAPGSECACVRTASGHTACLAPASRSQDGCESKRCRRDKHCPKGQVCAVVPGCCAGKARICAIPCPAA